MSTHVRDAYDKGARNTTSVAERQNSRTIHLRQFNNWIKAILVQKYCPEPYAAILDVACGRGGDIPKWKRKNPNQFVFGDISIDSLKEAYKKYRAVKCACRAFFLGGDIFGCRVKDFIPENMRFHISSCQFALHYSFRDEEYATNAVRNLCPMFNLSECDGVNVESMEINNSLNILLEIHLRLQEKIIKCGREDFENL